MREPRLVFPLSLLLPLLLLLLVPLSHSLFVCNNGTEHECVCERANGEALPAGRVDCEQFIAKFQSRELPVVDMRVRHVNLQGRLHTGESYESYFKRRIATIVSAYCERQAHECPGTGLRLHTALPAEGTDEAEASVLYSDDSSEPLITQDNVLLLRLERERGNVSRLCFVVSRQLGVGSLSENDIVDPVKVKYILAAQRGPLARVLGGIRIESVRTTRLKRELKPEDKDNSKLLIMVSIIGAFFGICYIIGGVRIYRDCQKRRREMQPVKTEEDGIAYPSVPNYGACDKEEKRRRKSEDKPNGRLASLPREQKPASPYENSLRTPSDYSRVESPIVYDERSFSRMFMCDPSQLPMEQDVVEDMTDVVVPRHHHRHHHQHHHSSSPQKQRPQEPVKAESPRQGAVPPLADLPSLPALVLVPSTSQHDSALSSTGSSTEAPSSVPATQPHNVPRRPKSRRGSRLEEESSTGGAATLDVVADVPARSRTAHQLDQWSSSEEGDIDVYYKMSDDEEIKADPWTKPPSTHEDDEEEIEGDIVYQRLHEDSSPVPPKSLEFPQSTFSDEEAASPESVEDLR